MVNSVIYSRGAPCVGCVSPNALCMPVGGAGLWTSLLLGLLHAVDAGPLVGGAGSPNGWLLALGELRTGADLLLSW